MREWKRNNREKAINSQKKYRAENPEKIRAYRRTYRSLHPGKYNGDSKKWRQANPEGYREHNRRSERRRRARRADNGYSFYTTDQILEKYGAICYICEEPIDLSAPRKAGLPGWEKGLHIDHINPIYYGGEDSLDNVAPTHAKCNLTKATK
jgi:5-methylcytosine-specific restriction endonuclease McrA